VEHNNVDIVREARTFLGVKFRHQGRSITHGVDCLGLVMCVADKLSLKNKNGQLLASCDNHHYSKTPNSAQLHYELSEHLNNVPLSEMRAGDIALMEYDKNPQHLAIITDYDSNNNFGCIHAFAPTRKVVEHRLDGCWIERITHIFRLSN